MNTGLFLAGESIEDARSPESTPPARVHYGPEACQRPGLLFGHFFPRDRHLLPSLSSSPAFVGDDLRDPGALRIPDTHPLRAFFMPVWP
jgi:hypothetical protein